MYNSSALEYAENSMVPVIATASPVQGLTCFHGYHDRDAKTLEIDMLYCTLDAYHTSSMLTLGTETTKVVAEGLRLNHAGKIRVSAFIKQFSHLDFSLHTTNNFSTDTGLASSASGFSCLAAGVAR